MGRYTKYEKMTLTFVVVHKEVPDQKHPEHPDGVLTYDEAKKFVDRRIPSEKKDCKIISTQEYIATGIIRIR